MKPRLRLALSPPAELGRADTGLRFTDILFGFVIRELFLRLQNWSHLSWYIRWQLIVGTALVLGSWIGFRRSLNRTEYEVKFFNLPLLRFLTDQLMVILYFRVAVLTAVDAAEPPAAETLIPTTIQLLVFVFTLYAAWDLLGIWMAKAKEPNDPTGQRLKYRKVNDRRVTEASQAPDWYGFLITLGGLAALLALWRVSDAVRLPANASGLFVWATVILVGYRLMKEVRTSWRSFLPVA